MTIYRRTRRSGDDGPTVSLFPFLAVLLCTMGMLVMILVLVSRNAGTQNASSELPSAAPDTSETAPEDDLFLDPLPPLEPAEPTEPETLAQTAPENLPQEEPKPIEPAAKNESKSAEERCYEDLRARYNGATLEELESETENADWFLSELQKVRDRTAAALAEERRKLAETEAQIAKMVEQLVDLNKKAIELGGGEEGSETPASLKAEMEKRAAEIARLTAEVERLREKAKETEGEKSYAILPYRGKSGTFRRPIYIECTEHGIYLMPEEIPFIPEDFLVAKYPGNPFDTALRAARQYYIEQGQGSGENEPYPLLIIRPGAAQSYYAAKAALASWGGDYGYEFVEDDWKIEYPKSDPELMRRVEEQIVLSRSRMAVPLAAIQGEIERAGRGGSGGGMGKGGSGSGVPAGSGGMTGASAGRIASQLGPYAKIGEPQAPLSENTTGGSGKMLPGGGYQAAGTAPGYAGGGTAGGGNPSPLLNSGNQSENKSGGVLSETAAASANSAPAGSSAAAPKSISNAVPGIAASNVMPPNAVPSDAAHAGTVPVDESMYTPFAERPAESAGASGASGVDPCQTVGNLSFLDDGRPASESDGPAGNVASPSPEEKPDPAKKTPKVAETKIEGAINLREEFRKPSQMAIERPIIIECRADRIVFPAQAGLPGGREVLLSGADADQEILATVLFCVKSWRVAGRNMYWSPWIKATSAPDGEAAYQRLAALMESERVRIDRVRQ